MSHFIKSGLDTSMTSCRKKLAKLHAMPDTHTRHGFLTFSLSNEMTIRTMDAQRTVQIDRVMKRIPN